jgi:hypothetical protein
MAPGAPGAVTELAVDLLRQTRPWVVFLSVLSFVGAGLCLLAGVFMLFAGAMAGAMGTASAAGAAAFSPALLGAIYLPMSALYIYPGIKLWAYGAAIGRLMASRASAELENALLHQKSFWKYSGISAIVLIALYALLIVAMIIVGVAAALGR